MSTVTIFSCFSSEPLQYHNPVSDKSGDPHICFLHWNKNSDPIFSPFVTNLCIDSWKVSNFNSPLIFSTYFKA
uniref:Uncharacterized protein n=1 Tax=Rhizophora mucronata TaxID=61149 RepID=A0A2P2MY12_RHIMU